MTTHAPTYRQPGGASTAVGRRWQRYVHTTLAVAGGVAVAVGTALAIAPRSFIDTEPTADLLSETRAPGAALLALGVFILAAAIRRKHLHTAALIATLTYLGYGFARIASVIVDGRPSGMLVVAAIIELAIGIASLAAVIASNDGSPTAGNVR
jgi:hypothetical protein